ncbi:MAG: MBL fold metallo-hydrolase [Candidatus Nanohaloarchaea archaeon]
MSDSPLEYNGFEVYWYGHASVRVADDGFNVAVDPFDAVTPDFEADLILVTHADEGHYDPGKIEELCNGQTCVVVPESMEEKNIPSRDVEYVREGEKIDVFGIEIEAVPMYNSHHPRGEGFGYRFVMRGNSFYVAGDTGLTDEARGLEGRVDVAFLPVEGVYTMDVEDAVKAAVRIKPGLAVPYHYGEPFFDDVDVDIREFQAELEERNLEPEVLERSG